MENIELKANEIFIVPLSKFEYQLTPLTENAIVITLEEFEGIKNQTKQFDLENNCVVEYDNTEELERQRKQELRAMREPLLTAFDKYKSNVNYGVEIEPLDQREKIIKWYNEIKNLNENYIIKDENIPERIKYYL